MHTYQLKHKHNCTHKEAVPISSWVMCDIFQFEICWAFVRGCLIALHFIVLQLLCTMYNCTLYSYWNCTLSKWRSRIYCCTYCIALYFFALYFLCCNRAWYMDITRTQNYEVVLHFAIACCNIGVYTGVYCYIVVLVHGYIRAQNQGCSVTPVSCCSTSSLAQLDPQFITLEDWTTIPTNSPRYPQILELLRSVDSTQMPWFQLIHFSFLLIYV